MWYKGCGVDSLTDLSGGARAGGGGSRVVPAVPVRHPSRFPLALSSHLSHVRSFLLNVLQEVFARERGQGSREVHKRRAAGDDVSGAGEARRDLELARRLLCGPCRMMCTFVVSSDAQSTRSELRRVHRLDAQRIARAVT